MVSASVRTAADMSCQACHPRGGAGAIAGLHRGPGLPAIGGAQCASSCSSRRIRSGVSRSSISPNSRATFVSARSRGRGRSRLDHPCDDRARADRHHGDAVGERDGLGDIVRHEHDGLADALPDIEQHLMHAPACERIKRRERLIHQQHVGFDRETRARSASAAACRPTIRQETCRGGHRARPCRR